MNNCHFEHSEKSMLPFIKIPHYVRDDKCELFKVSLDSTQRI